MRCIAYSAEQLQMRAVALQMSSVPDEAVEQWQAEIDALKAGKRLKWKGVMQNQTGARSVVRYDPAGVNFMGVKAHFVHKLSEERKGKRDTEIDWLPVLSFSAKAAMTNAWNQKDVVTFAPSGARPMIPEGIRSDCTYHTGGEAIQGDPATVRELIQEQINTNATGKHSARNHPIHVPTAAGQPVRG